MRPEAKHATDAGGREAALGSTLSLQLRRIRVSLTPEAVGVIAGLACAVLAAYFAFFPLTNTDIWWHMASGREILRRGALLHEDPFTFTPTRPWIDVHWLFQLGALALYRIAGAGLLVAAKLVLFAGGCLAAYAAFFRRGYAVLACMVIPLLLYEARYLVLARPVVVTLLLLGLFILLLERYRRSGRVMCLAALLPLQIIWANTQGLFALGWFAVGAYAAEAVLGLLMPRQPWARDVPVTTVARTRLTWVLGAALGVLVVSVVNPYGLRGMLFPLRLFERIDPGVANVFSLNVSENIPLLDLIAKEPHYVVAVAVTALLTLALFGIRPHGVRPAHLILFVGFLYLAFRAQRNVLLFLFVGAPLLAHYAAGAVEALRRAGPRSTLARHLPRMVMLLAAILLVIRTIQHTTMVSRYPRGSALSPFRHPVAAVDHLQRHPVPGNIFNSVRHGGYLIWQCYPPKKAFIDGRLILRTPEFYADYLTILDTPSLFPAVAEKFDITHVLIPTAIFERYIPLATWLYHSGDWKLTFADGATALFVADSLVTVSAIDLSDPEDVAGLMESVGRRWRRNSYIRREGQAHVSAFVDAVRRASLKSTTVHHGM